MKFSSSQSEMKTNFWLSKLKNLKKTPIAKRNKKLCLRVTESNNSSLNFLLLRLEINKTKKDEIWSRKKKLLRLSAIILYSERKRSEASDNESIKFQINPLNLNILILNLPKFNFSVARAMNRERASGLTHKSIFDFHH